MGKWEGEEKGGLKNVTPDIVLVPNHDLRAKLALVLTSLKSGKGSRLAQTTTPSRPQPVTTDSGWTVSMVRATWRQDGATSRGEGGQCRITKIDDKAIVNDECKVGQRQMGHTRWTIEDKDIDAQYNE